MTRLSIGPRLLFPGAAAGLVLATLTGCVTPAPTADVYEAKAGLTAQDALSPLETARLTVETSGQAKLPGAYLETVLSESEDAFDGVQGTFDSVQPPDDAAADALRDELDELLSEGSDGLRRLRVLARRPRTPELGDTAASMDDLARKLSDFAEEHRQ